MLEQTIYYYYGLCNPIVKFRGAKIVLLAFEWDRMMYIESVIDLSECIDLH